MKVCFVLGEVALNTGEEDEERVVFSDVLAGNVHAHCLAEHLVEFAEVLRVDYLKGNFGVGFLMDDFYWFNNLAISVVINRLDKLLVLSSHVRIEATFNQTFSGISLQVMNCPLDLFVEDKIYNEYPEMRPVQILSLMRTEHESIVLMSILSRPVTSTNCLSILQVLLTLTVTTPLLTRMNSSNTVIRNKKKLLHSTRLSLTIKA